MNECTLLLLKVQLKNQRILWAETHYRLRSEVRSACIFKVEKGVNVQYTIENIQYSREWFHDDTLGNQSALFLKWLDMYN